MPKPSAAMITVFKSMAPGGPDAVIKKMFGMPAAFVGGNMFMGLFGDEFQVRLSPEDREAAVAAGARPFTPMGRPMKEYVVLPDGVIADERVLRDWVAKAYTYASGLPAKVPKPARERGPRAATGR